MTPIIRSTLAAVCLAATAACLINPSSHGAVATAPRVSVTPLPSAGASGAVWVISTVGLNVRSQPDPNADKVATLVQATQLTVTGKQAVGPDTWLHVKTEAGQVEGWVLDRPDLVIHRAVSQHVEQSSGYSILFPADWSPTSGNPATFTGPSGPGGGSLLVQTAADPTQLAATPTQPGQELRQESPIEVYGRTTYMTLYRSNGGGFEYVVKVQFPKTKVAYLFDFKQPSGDNPDISLFEALLQSVIVPGEG